VRSLLLVCVVILASTPGLAAREAVILMYHRFGEERSPSTSVRLEQFEAHLDHLADRGYAVVPLSAVVTALGGGAALPERAVAITIDDAYRSVFEHAYPRLRDRGLPFTVFVATDPVDQGLAGYMTWDQIREMSAHGATFANHGATHDSLVERREGESADHWRQRVTEDIRRGARRLADELESAPTQFAYPYGEYDSALAALVLELGYVGFGQQSGAVGPTSDRRALPRFPMAEAYAELASFEVKIASLPLPVTEVEPWNPVTVERRPRLQVTLAATDARLDELACYSGDGERIVVEWLERGRRFVAQARGALAIGRGRYNCTAPAATGGRYHWFSQPWIVRPYEAAGDRSWHPDHERLRSTPIGRASLRSISSRDGAGEPASRSAR